VVFYIIGPRTPYQGIPDTARIDADWQRLNAHIENEGEVS
jgi:hypothetical protein